MKTTSPSLVYFTADQSRLAFLTHALPCVAAAAGIAWPEKTDQLRRSAVRRGEWLRRDACAPLLLTLLLACLVSKRNAMADGCPTPSFAAARMFEGGLVAVGDF